MALGLCEGLCEAARGRSYCQCSYVAAALLLLCCCCRVGAVWRRCWGSVRMAWEYQVRQQLGCSTSTIRMYLLMYFGIFYLSKSVFLLVKVNSTCLSSCLSLSLSLYLLMCLVWLFSRTNLQVLCYVLVKALVCTSLLVSNIFSLQNLLDLKELRDPGGGSGIMK